MNTRLNKSDYILLTIYFIIAIILQIFDYYESQNMLIEYLLDIPTELVVSLSLIFLFMNWLIPRYIVEHKQYVYFVLYCLLFMFCLGILVYTIGFWSAGKQWSEYPTFWKLFRIAISDMAKVVSLPLGLLLGKKYYEGQIQFSNIQRQQKENELKLLRSQIDPHFLFNNLNTLDALVDSNPEKAKEYINRLSLLYRYLISTKEAEIMELAEEMKFAENYIFLTQTRFGDDYLFEIIKNSSFQNKFIPTGALQTLLENIVKHNRVDFDKKIITTITITDDWLIVENTKSKNDQQQESFGIGIDNMKRRYAILSKQNVKITSDTLKFKIAIPILEISR